MEHIITQRLAALRAVMKEKGVDAYLVPTDDFHSSEYVGDHFKCRQYITGFTGSAGTAVITEKMAGLWTDGRYFIQAAQQLKETTVELFKMGQPGVLSLHEFLQEHLQEGQCLAFDGRTVGEMEAAQLEAELAVKHISIKCDEDLIAQIWEDRPQLSCEQVMELELQWAGQTRAEKIKEVRTAMEEANADIFLLTCLDDIAWLLNIRGNDIACNPVVLSYLAMTGNEIFLFANKNAFPKEVIHALKEDGVSILPYDDVYAYAAGISKECKVLLCKKKVNSRLVRSLPEDVQIIDQENPTVLPKACKNKTEVENERKAHIKDGVAVTRFIYWLKQNIKKTEITELSAEEQLYKFRSEQEHFMGNSFAPIISYGAHAAIVHYSATKETDIPMEAKGLVLCDTGGQYLEGTTDITRTIALGETTEEEKLYFTAVLRGHLNLADAKFPYGCRGINFDYLARAPLWELGKDYNHGTGHGVGYFLNVHEGPNAIRWRLLPDRGDNVVLEEGMITSDEPGYYEEGKFGIRHENLIVCVKDQKTEYGQFMRFEPLTMVPFDLDAVVPEQMTSKERELLNQYHKKVYETIAPYLPKEEQIWLAQATREI